MELSIGQLVKIILGILVVAAVGYGLYMFFSNNVSGTFGDMDIGDPVKMFLALL